MIEYGKHNESRDRLGPGGLHLPDRGCPPGQRRAGHGRHGRLGVLALGDARRPGLFMQQDGVLGDDRQGGRQDKESDPADRIRETIKQTARVARLSILDLTRAARGLAALYNNEEDPDKR